MAKCSSCNKFCSYDDPAIQSSTVTINGEEVQIEVEGVLNSACCDAEVKTCSLAATLTLEHKCPNADLIGREVNGEEIEDSWADAEADDLEGYSRAETTHYDKRKGKMVATNNPRYWPTFYGFSGDITLHHETCDEDVVLNVGEKDLEAQASSWEEV